MSVDQPLYANQLLLVKIVETEPGVFSNGFRQTYKAVPCRIKVSNDADYGVNSQLGRDHVSFNDTCTAGLAVTIEDGDEDRAIMVCNFRNNKIIKNSYHIAKLVGNFYVIDNQTAFLENL